ncbi:hypothetical protein [Hymenobacter koreensis]|uniref:Uncharacterized protein n=1 Tax=Hymenobacter koreensis TaxID=1084523 RepID=A0ABP8IU15_9BACT
MKMTHWLTAALIAAASLGANAQTTPETPKKSAPATRTVQGVYASPVGSPVLPPGNNRPRRLAVDDSAASPNYGPPQTATADMKKEQKPERKRKRMKPLPSTIHP